MRRWPTESFETVRYYSLITGGFTLCNNLEDSALRFRFEWITNGWRWCWTSTAGRCLRRRRRRRTVRPFRQRTHSGLDHTR